MKAIRGATTVLSDTADEIKSGVRELLNEITKENKLTDDNIICIMFSNTADITSYYPAKACRESGFFSCPLYSSLEPSIEGALKKCIRVMILADIDYTPKHIYLKEAKNLRKDLTKVLNIAIDGPAGSGKSTIAKAISKKFNILYLDTGAMYRTCALACVQKKIDVNDSKNIEKLMQEIDISVKYENGNQQTFLNSENVSEKIRTPEISMLASKVSAHGCVRTKMVEIQRNIAHSTSCVLDGRDIGTHVLPDAEYKFFLTASAEVRADRRMNENKLKGFNQPYEEVLNEIILRDKQDMTREISPLVKADDAVEIDTGNLSVEEVVNTVTNYIQSKI